MRRFVSLFIILLIALRGFVGDAMAIEMSSMHGNRSIQTHQMAAMPTESSAHPCHGAESASVGSDVGVNQDAAEQSSSANCTSCQVCHSPALQSTTQQAASFAVPQEHSVALATVWMSAEFVQIQKPPVL